MKLRDLQSGIVFNTKSDCSLRVLVRFTSSSKDYCYSVYVNQRKIRFEYTDQEVLFVRPSFIDDVNYSSTFFQKLKSLFFKLIK